MGSNVVASAQAAFNQNVLKIAPLDFVHAA